MTVDWGFAGQVGGVGFGMVFVLLIILAIVIWVTGKLCNRSKNAGEENKENQKGA